MTERDELRDLAADPSTPWSTLHTIAQERPDLRAVLAANPATYPDLLAWLATLGDPAVDAALAGRAAGPGAPSDAGTQVLPAAGSPADPERTTVLPAETSASTGHTSVLPEGDEKTVPGDAPGEPTSVLPPATGAPYRRSIMPAGRQTPTPVGPDTVRVRESLAPETPTAGVRAATGTTDPTGRGPMWAVLALVAALLVVATVWVLDLRGQDDPAPVTATEEGTGEATEEPPAEPTEEPTEDPEEADPTEARDALLALPAESTCSDPDTDASVVNTYAETAAPGGAWEDEATEGVFLQVMTDLQESCDAAYVLQLRDTLLAGSDVSPAVVTTLNITDGWLTEERPAPEGAVAMDDFTSPSGNISCVLGEGSVSCTIEERSFADPAGCGDGPVTVVVPAAGEPVIDCDAPAAEGAGALEYGETAVAGAFACTSEEDGVTCWSTPTGRGFTLARAEVTTF